MKRRLATLVGVVLFAVAAGFCVATFVDERGRVGDALADAAVGWLVLGLLLAAAAMGWLAQRWHACLAALGADAPGISVARWYFVGELGKYVPGGIWPVVGRGELARRGGVGRTVAYQSVALSLAAWIGAAVLPLAAVVARPSVQAAVARLARKVSGGRVEVAVLPWRQLVGLVVSYVPAWVFIGGVTAAVVAAYGGDSGWRAPAVAVAAWVCGFVAVPVPAGAGVREAVFVAASGLPSGLALTVAITTRLAFVAVDLAGAGLAAGRMDTVKAVES